MQAALKFNRNSKDGAEDYDQEYYDEEGDNANADQEEGGNEDGDHTPTESSEENN